MARGPTRGRRDDVFAGLVLLGRFRAEGFARFENSTDGFLASLAPWIAFLLVSGALFAFRTPPLDALTTVVVLLCWLLVPPVVTQAVALAFGRDERWLRFATASAWCEWLTLIAYAVGLLLVSVGVEAGMPERAAPMVVLGITGIYWLALHVFLARAGLDLGPGRAVLAVGATVVADALLAALALSVGGPAAHLLTM